MKVLTCTTPGNLEYSERADPDLAPGHAIIRIKRVGVCGTDLHAFEGTQPFFNYPRVLGHEIAAEVIAIDDNAAFSIGDSVTIVPYFNCGHCVACRNGKPNCCATLQVAGVHVDGAMAQYYAVPSYALVHSNGLTDDLLALVEPLAIGAHAVRRAGVGKGEFVLVIGAGPIGLGVIEYACLAGGRVVVLDVQDHRLKYCSDHLNDVITLNAKDPNVIGQIRDITGGDMIDVVFDATGNLAAINHAFQYLAHGGRFVLVGLQRDNISVSHPEFHKREATLMSSRNATKEDFQGVITTLRDGRVKAESYITHHVPFGELKDSFTSLLNPASQVIKALVDFENLVI